MTLGKTHLRCLCFEGNIVWFFSPYLLMFEARTQYRRTGVVVYQTIKATDTIMGEPTTVRLCKVLRHHLARLGENNE